MTPEKEKMKKSEEDYLKRLELTFKSGSHLIPSKDKKPLKGYDVAQPKQEQKTEPENIVKLPTPVKTQPQHQQHQDNNPKTPQRPVPQQRQSMPIPPQILQPEGQFESGTILILEDGSLAIYKNKIQGKEYDLVYILNPKNAKVEAKGIYVSGYETEKIGLLPEDLFNKIQKTLLWSRDAIIYHLDKYSFCSRIPQVNTPSEEPSESKEGDTNAYFLQKKPPQEVSSPTDALTKGRKMTVMFGDKAWESYFWGKDELGTIVVHQTTGDWTAMHLDLKRFGESIKLGEILSPDKIKQIDDIILNK